MANQNFHIQSLVLARTCASWALDNALLMQVYAGGVNLFSSPVHAGEPLSALVADLEAGSLVVQAHEQALAGQDASYEQSIGDQTYLVTVTAGRDAQGGITGCWAVALDISAYVATELGQHLLSEPPLKKMALDLVDLKRQTSGLGTVMGSSAEVTNMRLAMEQAAGMNYPVMLSGEPGAGKKWVANTIHDRSPRAKKALVKVDCRAVTTEKLEQLIAGEGKLATALGGSIYLDEVSRLDAPAQEAMLQVIRRSSIGRYPDQKNELIDVRFFASTTQDLRKEVAEGRFREDLFYHLNVFPIYVPSLRQRSMDIPLLAQYFIDRINEQAESPLPELSQEQMAALLSYDWPNNMAELSTMLEQAAQAAEGGSLDVIAILAKSVTD